MTDPERQRASASSLEDGGTEGRGRTKRPSAQRGLLELIAPAKVFYRIGIIDAVMEAARGFRVTGIGAERRTDSRGGLQNLRIAAEIANRGPSLRVRSVAESNVDYRDRRDGRPVRAIVGIANRLARHAELCA